VTYHFGSKEGLYHEILGDCLSPLREGIAEVEDLPLPAMERVEWPVRGVFRHIRENQGRPATHGEEAQVIAKGVGNQPDATGSCLLNLRGLLGFARQDVPFQPVGRRVIEGSSSPSSYRM